MQVWSTVAATQAGAHPWATGFAHQPGVGWGGAAWAPEAATTYRNAGRADIVWGGVKSSGFNMRNLPIRESEGVSDNADRGQRVVPGT